MKCTTKRSYEMPLSCSTRSSESIVLSQYNASDQVDGRTVGEHTDLINGLLALKKKCTLAKQVTWLSGRNGELRKWMLSSDAYFRCLLNVFFTLDAVKRRTFKNH